MVAGRAGAAGGRVAGRAPQPIAACQKPRAQARGSAAAAPRAERRCRGAPQPPSAESAERWGQPQSNPSFVSPSGAVRALRALFQRCPALGVAPSLSCRVFGFSKTPT